MPDVEAFLLSPLGAAVKALLVAAIVVFVLGVAAAVRDGTFEWHYIDSFVRSTILGRVIPVVLVGLIAYISGDQIITGAATIAAGAVGAGLLTSALESLRQLTMPPAKSAAVNTLPDA